MKLLLDTHVWFWCLTEPERLTKRVASALDSAANQLWFSPISIWEIGLLRQKGRISLKGDLNEWVQKAMAIAPMNEAPITLEIALETAALSHALRDPADRFLAATARLLGLTLVTADEQLISSKECTTLPNR